MTRTNVYYLRCYIYLKGLASKTLYLILYSHITLPGVLKARVADARRDTCSREVLRHPELKDSVELNRIRDHFICKLGIP